MDIYGKIEKYSDLGFAIDAINQEKQALIDQVLTPEIKEKLAEIDAEFDPKSEQISQEKSMLEAEIKQEILQAGQTVKGTFHSFVWSKPRVKISVLMMPCRVVSGRANSSRMDFLWSSSSL